MWATSQSLRYGPVKTSLVDRFDEQDRPCCLGDDLTAVVLDTETGCHRRKPTCQTARRPASARSSRERTEGQFGDRIRLGVLTEEITPEEVDEVLESTGRFERRRRVLPARAVVYFVLALCLFSSSDSAGPQHLRRQETGPATPARQRQLPAQGHPTSHPTCGNTLKSPALA